MLDAQPLNLNAAFYEESLSQAQTGELLRRACASHLTRLLSHIENACFSMSVCTEVQIYTQIQQLLNSSMTPVIVRGRTVTVLISTFSEFEDRPSTICLLDELRPEPETQPEAIVGAPRRHRTKRKKVLPSFVKGARADL